MSVFNAAEGIFGSPKENMTCDVLIIGGGLLGCLTAYFLTGSGLSAVLCEKNSIASGAASRINGIFGDGNFSKIYLEHKEKLPEVIAETDSLISTLENASRTVFDHTFGRCDLFIFTDSRRFSESEKVKREYRLRKYYGSDCEFQSAEAAMDGFSFDISKGVYIKKGACEINPVNFCKKAASYVSVNGTDVFEDTEIGEVNASNGVFSAKTPEGIVFEAKTVIDCRGGKDRPPCPGKFRKKAVFTAVTFPVSTFAGWQNRCIIKDFYKNSISLRTDESDRIIMTLSCDVFFIKNIGNIISRIVFGYMEELLRSMFFGISGIKFAETDCRIVYESKQFTFEEDATLPGFFYPTAPDAGILQTVKAASDISRLLKQRLETG